jgi:hypothetical protein
MRKLPAILILFVALTLTQTSFAEACLHCVFPGAGLHCRMDATEISSGHSCCPSDERVQALSAACDCALSAPSVPVPVEMIAYGVSSTVGGTVYLLPTGPSFALFSENVLMIVPRGPPPMPRAMDRLALKQSFLI